jgi:cytochrome c oxidase cbb3-type subunit 3
VATNDAGPSPRVPSAAHGATLYARMCAVCHGAEGQGYVADQAPALAHPDFLASVSDEFLRFAIAVGRQGTTMSAWQTDHGGPLSPDDVGDVIAHLRSWQKGPALAFSQSSESGDQERGKRLFAKHCASCHGPKAPYVHIQNRQLLVHATAPFLRHAIQTGRPGTKMPGFANTLGERGVEDVISYLRGLPSWAVPGETPGDRAPPPIPLGPVPLNPRGPEPRGFRSFPNMTSVDVVGAQLKRGARMVLIDARAPSDYINGHIRGAVSVPFYDPFAYLAQLPSDVWLVCYCGCPHAESGALAKQLHDQGFRKVTILDEGLGVWTEKGHPMQTGTAP